MENIKTAGFWSSVANGLKNLWKKYNDFFDDKQQFKAIMEGFRNNGLNADPAKMKMFKENNQKYIENDGQIYLIAEDKSETEIFNQCFDKIKAFTDRVQQMQQLNEDTIQELHNNFEKYWKKLEVVKIDNKTTLISIK